MVKTQRAHTPFMKEFGFFLIFFFLFFFATQSITRFICIYCLYRNIHVSKRLDQSKIYMYHCRRLAQDKQGKGKTTFTEIFNLVFTSSTYTFTNTFCLKKNIILKWFAPFWAASPQGLGLSDIISWRKFALVGCVRSETQRQAPDWAGLRYITSIILLSLYTYNTLEKNYFL